jgi:adenylate cyclase
MTTRALRLGSGMVLWFYIAIHLINHSLGLISLDAAEQGMRISVAIWHSLPGTVVLYGAFAVHLSLALVGLYRRHTLRLPPFELLRIGFGLSFPILLLGHAVTTRVAYEWYGLLPQYQRVVESLVSSGSEGRQLALLAPGWLHGCMGLHVALRHRAFFQKWRWAILSFFLILPIAGASGFLAMTHEIASLTSNADWQHPRVANLPKAKVESLGHLRNDLLAGYASLLITVLVARVSRRVFINIT